MRRGVWLGLAILAILGGFTVTQLPMIAAGGLLHPYRRANIGLTPPGCVGSTFETGEVILRGWTCATSTTRRGTIIYLHGVADNRSSSAGVIARYLPRGFDAIAYDSRAHGESSGDSCTYGARERDDVRAVITAAASGPVILIGTSLGAAVALQAAAGDARVTAVIAAEVFSDLETAARERVPRVIPDRIIREAFRLAERRGEFQIDDASPVRHAATVSAPVLLIHGDDDRETGIAHSRRVFEALPGRRRLVTVLGAGHNQSLHGEVWREVDEWIERSLDGGQTWRTALPDERFVSASVRKR